MKTLYTRKKDDKPVVAVTAQGDGADDVAWKIRELLVKENRLRKARGNPEIEYSIFSAEYSRGFIRENGDDRVERRERECTSIKTR